MELSLTVTIIIALLTAALFGYATWRLRQPFEPLKVRFINYHVVQMACIVVILVMAAHVMTLISGSPPAPAPTGRF